ncbi:lamin tail domain-containing protein [Akkermansiaceae bacterium]|nr:lamin tail domain-containing protein [Akkermansiaceae bacterium]
MPVLSELMADNATTLQDEDGDFTDWIEIYNPAATPADIGGWHLSDDPVSPQRWTLPAGASVPAGGYLIIFASGKDRRTAGAELHTNFKLSSDGETISLSTPDGSTSSTIIYPELLEDVSFGIGFSAGAALVTSDAPTKLFIPTDDTLGDTWTASSFDDTAWTDASASLGFDDGSLDDFGRPPLGYWDFDDASNPAIALDTSGNAQDGAVSVATFTADGGGKSGQVSDRAMDFGLRANNANVKISGDFDTTATNDAVTISLWTFGGDQLPAQNIAFAATENANSGPVNAKSHLPWSTSTIFWDTAGCCDPSETRISKVEPDESKFKGQWNHYVFVKDGSRKEIWQNGELFHSGTNTAPMTAIRGLWIGSTTNGANSFPGLIDDFAIWGEALTPLEISGIAAGRSPLTPLSFEGEFTTDLQVAMQGSSASAFVRTSFDLSNAEEIDRLTLRLRYDDGVLIYLNGTEVARRNAPIPALAAISSRAKLDSLSEELIDISEHRDLLNNGMNVLAVHGLNDAVAGSDFLLTIGLEGATEFPNRFFPIPSPGSLNDPGVEGFVTEPSVTPGRGFFETPVNVTIASPTPGASIIYTLDGTEPASTNGIRIDPANTASLASTTITVSYSTPVRSLGIREGYGASPIASHTYLFAHQVGDQGPSPVGYPATWGVYGDHGPFTGDPFPADYEMDQEIVANTKAGHEISDAILAIPSVCISLPQAELFDATQGIWANSVLHGSDWERGASVEIIYPDDFSADFQVDAGLRINGGLSRQHFHAHKHSFRLNFRREYGASTLDHRLFPDSPVDRFDELVLRASSTDSWTVQDNSNFARTRASYIRDVWVKDTQLSMSRPGGHSRYVNVFLNGLYFGQYNLAERNDQRWNAEYLGGSKGDYDIIKNVTELDSGTRDAWEAMTALAQSGLETEAAYQLIKGNNPDGTRNPAFPLYLDVDNLIDYMILHIYIGSTDWPVKNWWSARERGADSKGFRFYAWDQEIALLSLTRTDTNLDGPFEEVSAAGPAFLYDRLRQNTSFQARFAARVQELMFDGGVLTPEKSSARWQHRQAEIDQSIVAESARWGDSRNASPYLRETDWLSEMAWVTDTYFVENHAVALKRFENVSLFPASSSTAPTFSHSGGRIDLGDSLNIVASTGTIHFTTDGSDPMALNGDPSTTSQSYTAPIPLTDDSTISARTLTAGTWSPLTSATYYLSEAASSENIAISEIHYEPLDATSEFIELTNYSTNEVDLSGVSFAAGIIYTFPQGIRLAAGEQIAITASDFSGRLDNGGEQLILLAENRSVIRDLTYSNNAPWPTEPATSGHSLTLISPLTDPNLPGSWRRSLEVGGSSGTSDVILFSGPSPSADLDGDGLSAFAEHALGTSDNVYDESVLSISKSNEIVTVSYPRQFGADDAMIILQTSTDLQSWTGQSLTTMTETNAVITAELPSATSSEQTLFARLLVLEN